MSCREIQLFFSLIFLPIKPCNLFIHFVDKKNIFEPLKSMQVEKPRENHGKDLDL